MNSRGTIMNLDRPMVMGVINLNDDSFYKNSSITGDQAILEKVKEMLLDGADIIDLGAMSTRPGALEIPIELEIERLTLACGIIRSYSQEVKLSIDTYRVEVLRALESFNINMVNDIAGGQHGEAIWEWTGNYKIPYVLTHIKGMPDTMQSLAVYDDVIKEILDYFIVKIPKLIKYGVYDIIIDPGIGFAKTIDQNFQILQNLQVFRMLEFPILVGLSRKSLIWKYLNISPEEALNGTTVLNMHALNKGARILRVHDVKAAKETIILWEKLNE